MDLALRMVKASRARPAIRSAVNPGRAERLAHPAQLGSQQGRYHVPADLDKGLADGARARARAAAQPAFPNRGAQDAGGVIQGVAIVLKDGGGRAVTRMRGDLDPLTSLAGMESPPVACMNDCLAHRPAPDAAICSEK